jgi:Ca2+-binding RTX toxin-like protein
MPIEAVSQIAPGMVYVLIGNDDLNVAADVTLVSLTADGILANSGQHVITVSGLIKTYDDAINTIGCEAPQTIVIEKSGTLIAGYTGEEKNGDGVILDGIGSTLVNHGTILASGAGLSLFVRDAGTTTISNTGYIFGEQFGIWNKFGIGVLHFTNTGVVESAGTSFFGGTAIDNVTNAGIMKGDVKLNGGNDVYLGQSGVVYGMIHGGDGDDRFVLGNAPDKVDGGFGFDTLDFSAVTVALTIDLANGGANRGATAFADTYLNIEAVIGGTKADILRGSSDDNRLEGRTGVDRLDGGAGQDMLIGGTGGDILTGGAGADVFAFNGQADFRDLITDFEVGVDILRFVSALVGLGGATGGLDPSRFHTGTSNVAGDSSDKFIFNTTDSTLWWDRDGSGSRHMAQLVADLQDGVILTAASIDLI